MVIRGNTRGNGQQLAQYLLGSKENDQVQILDVAGRYNARPEYLHQTLHSMSLTAELTKSPKGLYHAQINPAYSEDRKMTPKDWLKATDILANQLGLDDQRRVVVLHTKKGRTHAHVVFERYNHQTGKIISNSFSRLAQDRARKEMERVFEHTPTPHRNKHRPELKEALTGLWQQTTTGAEFVQAVYDNGYLLAEGVPRHPFMVVDENGRSFDLVRQLKDVRIKEVRQRLRHETLIPEKQAIEIMRERKDGSSENSTAEQQHIEDAYNIERPTVNFTFHKAEPTLAKTETNDLTSRKKLMGDFLRLGEELTTDQNNGLEKKKTLAGDFMRNGIELTDSQVQTITDESLQQPSAADAGFVEDASESTERSSLLQDGAEETITPVTQGRDPDRAKHRVAFENFLSAENDMFSTPARPDTDQQRQQDVVREFFDNQETVTPDITEGVDEKDDLQRLMQEQKDIRERNRQKTRKRSR